MTKQDAKEFRSSKNFKEIMGILQKVQSKSGFIWQSNHDQERITIDVLFTHLDPIQQKISIEFLSDPIQLKLDEPCFIKLPVKDAAFKTTLIALTGRNGVLDFPLEVVLEENRKEPRVNFQDEDQKTAVFQNLKSADPVMATKGTILSVANVSKHGMCAWLTNQQWTRFQFGDSVLLTSLGDHRLQTPMKASVVHKWDVEKRNQFGSRESAMKISFRFEEAIAQPLFDQFIYSDRMIAFNDERFFKDQAFRSAVNASMKNTLNKLLEKKNLASIFQKLEVKREENKYLKNHIELLCEVMCQAGKQIGWISENNLEKLVYVSYMHDVRYFDRPYLAKIPGKREMDLRKSKFTPEDIQTYLEGPVYASELAKEDNSAFPDAYKILLQHKERPDGKGFPGGVKGPQLAPLSCLFMVCHEFVDYVMAEPEWSYEEFVNRNKRVYVGTYFHKIFQVFEDLQ